MEGRHSGASKRCLSPWLVLTLAAFGIDALSAVSVLCSGDAIGHAEAILLLGRLVVMPLLASLAVRLAGGHWPCEFCRRRFQAEGAAQAVVRQPAGAASSPFLELDECSHGGVGPLTTVVVSSASSSSVISSSSDTADERARRTDAMIKEKQAYLKKIQARQMHRNILLVISYMYIVACSMWTALVVVRMNFSLPAATLNAVALVICMAMMNAEFALLKKMVLEATAGDPVLIPSIHEHALYWHDAEGKGFVMCSVCNEKVGEKTGGYMVMQCRTCQPNQWGFGGFSMCTKCYRKHASKAAEAGDGAAGSSSIGLRRGDKGPKPPLEMTPWGYSARIVKQLRLTTALTALSTVVLSQAFGAYVPKAQGDIVNALIAGSWADFNHSIVTFLVCVVVVTVVSCGQSISVSYMMTEIYTEMSMRLFGSILSQDIAFYDNAMTGQLNARLTNDLGQATMPIPIIMNSLLANVITLIVGFAVCLSASWRLTLLALTFLSPVVYVQGVYSQWASKLQAAQFTYISDAQGAATQAFTNIRTVRSFCAGISELQKYSEHLAKSMNVGLRSAWGQGGATLLSNFLEQGASMIILYYGGLLALGHDGFEVGSIITFSYLWNRLSSAFKGLNDNLNQPVKAMSAGLRVFELLELVPDISENAGAPFPTSSADQIELSFENVEFTYQSRPEKQVLKRVNIIVEAGKTTAVVGKSGCGKSTFSKLAQRFYDPQQGRICVNSVDLQSICLTEYRKKIGIVSQDTQLFRRSVTENITYGMPVGSCTQEDVERAATMANADEFIKGLPEGYSTMVGEGGHDLSGGQKQRISIARALVRRPRLLLLDEATSSLDAENEAVVQGALDTLMDEMQGRCTILVIAHRLSTIKDASRIFVLDEGEVVEFGTHDELLQMDGRYATMISRQLQGGSVGKDDENTKAKEAQAQTKEVQAKEDQAQTNEVQAQIMKLFETLPKDKKEEVLKLLHG